MTPHGIKAIKALINSGHVRVNGELFRLNAETSKIQTFNSGRERWDNIVPAEDFGTFEHKVSVADKWAIIS